MTCDSGQEHRVYYYVHRTCGTCPESQLQVLLWLHPSVLKFVWSYIICILYYEIVEWKWNLVAHGDAREEKWRGKRRMEWVAKQASVWLGTVHPVLLQSFSANPHSKKASTRLNWHPRRYKWTRPFRWKTESGFCACAITFRLHSNTHTCNHELQSSQKAKAC